MSSRLIRLQSEILPHTKKIKAKKKKYRAKIKETEESKRHPKLLYCLTCDFNQRLDIFHVEVELGF